MNKSLVKSTIEETNVAILAAFGKRVRVVENGKGTRGRIVGTFLDKQVEGFPPEAEQDDLIIVVMSDIMCAKEECQDEGEHYLVVSLYVKDFFEDGADFWLELEDEA